jgi:YidC/Oxa1 family membrane protein insertase
MDKSRFILAIVFSAAILFGWSLLFPVKPPPPQSNANANSSATEQKPSPTATSSGTPSGNQDKQPSQGAGTNTSSETIAPRQIKVSTPLYDVVLDNHGAVATSWVIKRNKDNQRPLYSVGGPNEHPKPLELIPQDRVNQSDPREAPLRLSLVDGEKSDEGKLVDSLLGSRNYEVKELRSENEKTDRHLRRSCGRVEKRRVRLAG